MSTVVAGVLLAPAAHAAAPLSCHDTVSVDTTLTADLVCQEGGDGLVVDTDGVVLDLGGFTVVGGGWSGVSVTARDVVVRGGSLTGFAAGVGVEEGASAVVEQVSLRRNITGLRSDGSAVLRDSHVGANSVGVLAELGGQVVVERSDVARNPVGVAVSDEGSSVTVVDSGVRSNQTALTCWDSGTLHVRRSLVVDAGTALDPGACSPGGSTVTDSLFLHNDVHVGDPGSTAVAYSCTTFLGGRNAPPTAPCGSR